MYISDSHFNVLLNICISKLAIKIMICQVDFMIRPINVYFQTAVTDRTEANSLIITLDEAKRNSVNCDIIFLSKNVPRENVENVIKKIL